MADATSLPFDDGSFGYAVSVHTMQHLPDGDLVAALSEMARVVAPGGYLFLRDFAPGDLREGPRADGGIEYHHRVPGDVVPLLMGCEVLTSGIVEERTRFGGVRRRVEILARRVA